MLKSAWKILKENFAVGLAIATTFVTIVYAGTKFLIYTYWSGYFKRLNIDNNIMKLDYEGIIYQALLIFVMLLAVLYVMGTLEILYENKWNKYKEKNNKRIFGFLNMTVLNVFITSGLLLIVNYPWVIFICAWGNLELNLITMFVIIILLSLLEVGLILHHLIFDKKPNNKEVSLERKVAVGILSVLIIASSILSIIYFSGNRKIDSIKHVRLVENEQYMISYSNGEEYVLHKIELVGNEITIKINDQKVINNENVSFIIKEVSSVYLMD